MHESSKTHTDQNIRAAWNTGKNVRPMHWDIWMIVKCIERYWRFTPVGKQGSTAGNRIRSKISRWPELEPLVKQILDGGTFSTAMSLVSALSHMASWWPVSWVLGLVKCCGRVWVWVGHVHTKRRQKARARPPGGPVESRNSHARRAESDRTKRKTNTNTNTTHARIHPKPNTCVHAQPLPLDPMPFHRTLARGIPDPWIHPLVFFCKVP